MKRKIIKSAVAVLIASSIVTAVWAQYQMENTMNKDGLTEVKEFILSLPVEKQEALTTLHETHRNEMKTLIDSYKDIEKTDAIQAEIEAKMKELHTKQLSEVKALLVWVEWADAIIAKMEEKHETMWDMKGKMMMMWENMNMMSMSGSWMDMHMMKWKMSWDDAFIKTLSEEVQASLKTLKDTHHADIKTLLDSYKGVEMTDVTKAEIDAKLQALHDTYITAVKALLVWVEWAEEFISKIEAKKPSDMMGEHKGMMVNKWKMGDMKKRDNAKKVMAHKAKYDKKIGKTLAKVTDDKLSKLLIKLDQITEKIQNDTSFTDVMKNDYLDKIEALRDIITVEIGN